MATTTSGCDANRLTALARTLSSTYAFSPLCGREFHDELFSFQIEIRIPLDGLCEHTTRFCLYCAILDQPLALAGIMVASGRYTPPSAQRLPLAHPQSLEVVEWPTRRVSAKASISSANNLNCGKTVPYWVPLLI